MLETLKYNKIVSEQLFNEALQNFRGLMSSLQERPSVKASAKTSLNDYKILGNAPLVKEQGIAALKVIHRHKQLNSLALTLLEHLASYVHDSIQLFNELNNENYRGLVVGMSGGADSTLALVLACLLRDKYGYQALAVHCIHRLDPDDDIWLTNNQLLCERLKVELRTPVLNIVYGNGVSPEDSSRSERYKALLANTKDKSDCLVLGHQADDQVESFLLALKRGSGPHGLRGMRLLIQDERGVILRPLLSLHKIEVEQILVSLNYDYVFDLSNHYLKFERNFIRLKVLPKFRERFSAIDRSILRSQALCASEHDLAQRYIKEQLPKYLKTSVGSLSVLPKFEFDFNQLDLSDSNLVTMLLRAFYQEVIQGGVDFNVIERSYELMVKDHDKNGLIELNMPSSKLKAYHELYDAKSELTLCAATFLNSLQVFIKDSAEDLLALSGVHELKLNETLNIGSYSYSLAPRASASAGIKGAAFSLGNSASVLLDFNKTGSLKLKPVERRHSRELKKLFIEYQIAPWYRKAQPLVKDLSTNKILALGNVFTNDETGINHELYSLVIKRRKFQQGKNKDGLLG